MQAIHRLIALAVIGVFGVAVLHVDTPHPAAPRPKVNRVVAKQLPRVVVQDERVVVHTARIAKKAPHHTVVHKQVAPRVQPFVPTGTGMWIYQWHRTDGGQAARIVSRAKWAGLSALYLRTGSSWDGFTGGYTLPALLRATRGTGINVIAWDFPRLRRPGVDAMRLAHAAWIDRGRNGTHVAAVAPDIETPAEGTFNAAWRVRVYLHVLRQHLPKGVTILSTVPWPSSYRLGDYPYRTVAARSDVLVPMAYWYNNSPGYVTEQSIRYVRQFHKPVAPVGQGYDGKLDIPSLPHNNLSQQVPVFFRTAARAGARAVSIWSWQSAKTATWNAIARARHLFRAHR